MSVTVTYQGPFPAEMQGRTIQPGDTLEVPDHQAASAWFQPVKKTRVKVDEDA